VYYQCTDYQLNNLLITCDSNSEVTDNGSWTTTYMQPKGSYRGMSLG
jgi:hypothetical protein